MKKVWFEAEMITEIFAVGCILLLGMGLRILNIKEIRVMNMLPALLVAIGILWMVS